MVSEQVAHTRVKANAWLALSKAIKAAGVAAEAFPNGIAVQVDGATLYGPDALVNGGEPADDADMIAPNPIVVVEVVTQASRGVDTSVKLAGYFRVPSISQCLIVLADKRAVVHHTRGSRGTVETRVVASGRVDLDPPGIGIMVEELFEE